MVLFVFLKHINNNKKRNPAKVKTQTQPPMNQSTHCFTTTKRKWLATLTPILVAFLWTGCATIQPKNILLNAEKGIYEYRLSAKNSITLRNEYHQLVDTSNYESFKEELISIKNRYPFKKRIEIDHQLKKSDYELATSYGTINELIISGEYQKALVELNKLNALYPDIYKYSDAHYLKAHAYEQLGLVDSAKIWYGHFLKYSSQKYSSRFHGHRDDDKDDGIYIAERNYASNYRLDREQTESVKLHPIQPRYYYGSLQPGYTLNSEDMAKNSRGILMLLFGIDMNGYFSGGFQYYYQISERFNINPRFASSGNITEYSLAAPIQVYKSQDNRLGLKFTPFVNYVKVDSVKIDDQMHPLKESFMNVGARFSVGYYLVQHLAIGAYYQANFYNEQHPYHSKKSNIDLWMINEYDVSLYYNIHKGLSFKAGVKNDDLVAGFMWSCWELSYNITSPGMILRVDMY